MKLDDYYCESCEGDFLVRDGEEPNACPFCQSPELAWSHEVKIG